MASNISNAYAKGQLDLTDTIRTLSVPQSAKGCYPPNATFTCGGGRAVAPCLLNHWHLTILWDGRMIRYAAVYLKPAILSTSPIALVCLYAICHVNQSVHLTVLMPQLTKLIFQPSRTWRGTQNNAMMIKLSGAHHRQRILIQTQVFVFFKTDMFL